MVTIVAVGYASLPIVPSLRDITKTLSDQLVKPASAASKQAGDAIEKNVGQAAEKAAADVERARQKEIYVAQDVAKAEQAVEDARSKSEQAARKTKAAELDRERAVSQASTRLQKAEADYEKVLSDSTATAEQVEAAAEKVTQARLAGESDILRKENSLQKAQDESRRTAEQVEAASQNLSDQRLRSEDAADNLVAAEERLEKAQSESADGLKDWTLSAEDAEQASKDLESAQKGLEVGIAAAAGAVVAAMGGLFSIGKDFQGLSRQIAVSSGATGDDLRALEESAMSVATTVPVSFEESADALANLNTLTGETGPVLEELSSQVLNAANLLGEDGAGAAASYGSALKQWGVDASEGAEMMDGLFTVTQNYGIGLTELTGGLSSYGATLKNAGFEMDEAAILFGNLDAAGLSVSRIMPGLNKAFRDWAGEGKNVQDELAKTVQRIEETEDSQEALAIASETFGAQGAQRLTTAIREGQFSLEDFDTALGDTAGAIERTAEENRTLEESFQLVKNEALVAIEPLAREFFDQLVPAVELAGEKFTEMVAWVQENEGLVKGLASAIGGMAGGLMVARGAVIAFEAAMRIKNVALLISQKGWRGLNRAMRGNIIVLIATAIAGLVAGLVYFFRQTEKGQEIWEKFTEVLGTAWDWVVDKLTTGWEWIRDHVLDPFMAFAQETLLPIWEVVLEAITDAWEWLVSSMQSAWENILRPVFEAVGKIAVWLWENVLENVFGFILGYWKFIFEGMKLAWEHILRPVFELVGKIAVWLWENVLQPVFGFIGRAWDQLLTVMKWAWENILRPVFELVGKIAVWLGENVLAPIFDFIGNAWEHLASAIKWYWENVIQVAWDALSDALTWLYENIVQPVLSRIGDRWEDMVSILEAGWHWIRDNVFDPLGSGLETVQGWFQAAVEGIGRIWDGLREAAARPVRFVVDTVWNNGILRAWNAIADFLPGIDAKDPVPLGELGRYASGGVLPGYTPGRDPYTFIEPRTGLRIGLSGGEAIMRPEWTRAVGGPAAVERMNKAARSGRLDEEQVRIGQAHGFLGAFASGGVIGAMMNIVNAKYPNIMMTSGFRPGAGPYHGTYQATDWATPGAFGNSQEQLALAHDIAQTYPGSQELIYDSPGWSGNINSGRNVGSFGGFYNMAQAGPHHHHVHWAMTTPPTMQFGGGVFEGGSSGGGLGSAVVNWVADRARGVWDRMVSPIKGFIDDKLGDWGDSAFAQIPMGMFTSLRDTTWDFLTGLFGRGGGSNAGSVDVSDITGPVVDQVEAVFARHGFTGQQWEDAKWIVQQESNWNPTAVNPSSGAYGLFQFNPMGGDTLGAYLPDRNPDPAVQADAGARYMKDRYGDPTAARRFWEANQWYDEGGWLQPGLTQVMNETGKPEAVFTDWQWMIMRGIVDGTTDMADAIASVLGDDSDLVTSIRDFSRIVDEQSQIDWDTRLQSLEDHLAGIETNEEGEREQVRGRIGHPDEIALWAGTEIAEQFANDALGLIGLDGLVDLPRHLDDDLRVPFEQQSTPEDTASDSAAAETVSGQSPSRSVADQAAESGTTGVNQASTIEVNVTFNNVDPSNVDELRSMVDELADKVARAANGRRDAVAVSRGASI